MLLFMSSADYYSTMTDRWDTMYGTVVRNAAGGRNGRPSLQFGTVQAGLLKNLPGNHPTLIMGMWWAPSLSTAGDLYLFSVQDAGVSHFTLRYNITTGRLEVNRAGTKIGESAAIGIPALSGFLEMKCTIHDTAGAVEVRLNKVPVINVTGVDTKSTANAYANQVIFGYIGGGGGWAWQGMDFYVCDATGTKLNDFLGDVKIGVPRPTAVGAHTSFAGRKGTNLARFPSSGTVTPSGTNVTNPANAVNGNQGDFAQFSATSPSILRLTFSVAQSVDRVRINTTTDANSFGSGQIRTSNGTIVPISASAHTVFGAPVTLPAPETVTWIELEYLSGGGGLRLIYEIEVLGPGDDFANVDDETPDDDLTFRASSTVGHKDSFVMSDLDTTVGSVLAVQQVVRWRKDDAGSRTGRQFVRIGGTDYEGSDAAIGDTYAYSRRILEQNPATAADWTISDVNGLEAGYKVEA